MKVSRSDGNELTHEERRDPLVLVVTQRENTNIWRRWSDGEQDTANISIINYTIPQDGICKIEFPILHNSSELQLQVPCLPMPQAATLLPLSFCGRQLLRVQRAGSGHMSALDRESLIRHLPRLRSTLDFSL